MVHSILTTSQPLVVQLTRNRKNTLEKKQPVLLWFVPALQMPFVNNGTPGEVLILAIYVQSCLTWSLGKLSATYQLTISDSTRTSECYRR